MNTQEKLQDIQVKPDSFECSVTADIKYLARYIIRRIEVHFRFAEYRAFAGLEIKLMDRSRVGEAAK